MNRLENLLERAADRELFPEELLREYGDFQVLSWKESRQIFRARSLAGGEDCVIKRTAPGSPDSAAREYALLRPLDHPAIPRVIGCLEREGVEFLIRQYAPGETLDDLVRRDGIFGSELVLSIAHRLCQVLSYLHHQDPPVIYRDIKPQNIVMTPNGRMALIDFGIARLHDPGKDRDTRYLGSVEFASPEQFGFSRTDLRSDIYSLGKLMLYLATGASEVHGLRERISHPALRRIVSKCVQLAPDKRYSSVEHLARALDRALHPATTRQILLGTVTALCVLAVGGSLWYNLSAIPREEMLPDLPARADNAEDHPLVMLPVYLTVHNDGLPLSDCAVGVDLHHWYAPNEEGRAVLEVFPMDQDYYRASAAYQNRVACVDIRVLPESEEWHITLELDKTPEIAESLQLELPFGERGEFPLGALQADSVELFGQPPGVEVVQRDGEFVLTVEGVPDPGFYAMRVTATNSEGYAVCTVSLSLRSHQQAVEIATQADLQKIRDNLSGHYRIVNDLDLSGVESWQGIGDERNPFTGVLDGGGHRITGLTVYLSEANFKYGGTGFIGCARNAEIRGIIIEEPRMTVSHEYIDHIGAVVGMMDNSLLQDCAVLGGSIVTDVGIGTSVGGICGSNWGGLIAGCFNSADVQNKDSWSKAWTSSNVGGICGASNGWVYGSGNTGEIRGIGYTGGVAGFNDGGDLSRCYSSGVVDGVVYWGEFPPGGITQLVGQGRITSYSYFENGTAAVGAKVFNRGILLELRPIDRQQFRNPVELGNLGSFAAPAAWSYASLDSYYPVPSAIFRETTETPTVQVSGNRVRVAPVEGVSYFYSMDSDALPFSEESHDALDLQLSAQDTLFLYAAKRGCYDSEVVAVTL